MELLCNYLFEAYLEVKFRTAVLFPVLKSMGPLRHVSTRELLSDIKTLSYAKSIQHETTSTTVADKIQCQLKCVYH